MESKSLCDSIERLHELWHAVAQKDAPDAPPERIEEMNNLAERMYAGLAAYQEEHGGAITSDIVIGALILLTYDIVETFDVNFAAFKSALKGAHN